MKSKISKWDPKLLPPLFISSQYHDATIKLFVSSDPSLEYFKWVFIPLNKNRDQILPSLSASFPDICISVVLLFKIFSKK